MAARTCSRAWCRRLLKAAWLTPAISAACWLASSMIQSASCDELASQTCSWAGWAYPASGCALSALGTDAARGSAGLRGAFAEGLQRFVEILTDALPGFSKPARRRKAMAAMATMVGAVTLARAVDDPALSEEILDEVEPLRCRVLGAKRCHSGTLFVACYQALTNIPPMPCTLETLAEARGFGHAGISPVPVMRAAPQYRCLRRCPCDECCCSTSPMSH